MVTEKVEITIDPQQATEFIAAMNQALALLRNTDNAISAECHRGIERPEAFFLLVQWQTVDDHVAFTKTDDFARLRELIGPFYAGKPSMEHMERI